MYSLNPTLYGSVFVVPTVLVDKYIKLASFCAVKSLLWILKNQGGNFSVSEIAHGVGSSEADVKEALEYWVSEGVLVSSESGAQASAAPTQSDSYLLEKAEKKQETGAVKAHAEEKVELILPTFDQVAARINESKEIAGLINQVQMMLGRTTGYDMNARLVQMVDGYGFPVELVLRLIQYCVDLGKTSNAFILSVAKNWYGKEITTLEQADEYINEHTEAQRIYYELKLQTGLSAPMATPKQEEYLVKWDSWGMSTEMIVAAYNKTVENTGKISWAYMDKMLAGWYNEGLKTTEAVEKANEKFKAKKQPSGERSYDINKAISEAENGELVYEKKKKKKRGDSQ